jgi:NADPH:quinone reductase-like Zn-dependent oxidoreductase
MGGFYLKAMVYNKESKRFAMQDVAMPEPKRGEVLIQVVASSINAADYRTIKLGIGPKSGIYGADVAGKVVKLGEGITRISVGDEVLGDIANEGFGDSPNMSQYRKRCLVKSPRRFRMRRQLHPRCPVSPHCRRSGLRARTSKASAF